MYRLLGKHAGIGGSPLGEEWLPHFSCKSVVDVITSRMSKYPTREMTVLCGQTLYAFQDRIRENVEVRVGGAVYGMPRIQELLRVW